MPWVNFFGEKSCRAACRDGGSTWSSNRSNASRSACASLCACNLSGLCAIADDVTMVRRRETGRSLRSDNMAAQGYLVKGRGPKEGLDDQAQATPVRRQQLDGFMWPPWPVGPMQD